MDEKLIALIVEEVVKQLSAVQDLVEVVKRLNAGEHLLRKLAEQ